MKSFTKLYLIFSFINNYGTHYISSATIGSLYGEQSLISRESYFEMVTKGIDFELYAAFSAIGSINPSFDYNQTESETFKKVTIHLGRSKSIARGEHSVLN